MKNVANYGLSIVNHRNCLSSSAVFSMHYDRYIQFWEDLRDIEEFATSSHHFYPRESSTNCQKTKNRININFFRLINTILFDVPFRFVLIKMKLY